MMKAIKKSMEKNSISYYLNQFKKLGKEKVNTRVAFLSSFTIKGIKEVMTVKCREIKIPADVYIGPYNQYTQEIINNKSQLYSFNPDIIFLMIDVKALFGDKFLSLFTEKESSRKKLLNKKFNEIKWLIDELKKRTTAKIVLNNFEVPTFSPLTIFENKQRFGFMRMIKFLNQKLEQNYKEDKQVFLYDFELFASRVGKENLLDYKLYYLGDIKINTQLMPDLVEEYMGYVKALKSMTKKCLVLDLDNTLWGGVAGEDGINGIRLGPTPEGRPFLEFQQYILSLFNRGIILAINSKNNEKDVREILKKHPYQVLREKHFAACRINWKDKISNMESIAKELNIGLDSMVFLDDDKFNREMIRGSLPQVTVIDLPEDSSLYLKTISGLNLFSAFQITQEDRQKGKMYIDQKQRSEFMEETTDITEYLKALKMIVVLEEDCSTEIPRMSQLTQKTNQFNMTTRRYQEEDIEKFCKSKDYLVLGVKVRDKFGDNGLTGLAIVEKGQSEWKIDTFLLSCRIIGRKVEDLIIAYIVKKAKNAGAKFLSGEIIFTEKNVLARSFYKEIGFKKSEGKNADTSVWRFELKNDIEFPKFIKLKGN